MASGYAGLAPVRPARDPNGNGPFDCHGVLAPDPAWCCGFLGRVGNAKRSTQSGGSPNWVKYQYAARLITMEMHVM